MTVDFGHPNRNFKISNNQITMKNLPRKYSSIILGLCQTIIKFNCAIGKEIHVMELYEPQVTDEMIAFI